jgi:pericentriolar material 1 protein
MCNVAVDLCFILVSVFSQGEMGLNLFEELRDTIYTEVASLISQNESRPQYLLQLFTQLQTMTSDLMRQRTLFALQEIAQSMLTPEDVGVVAGPLKVSL